MRRSTHTGLFKRALVGVGAATALVGASLLGMPGISAAAPVGSAAPQPAAGEGGMEGACHPVGAGGIYGSLFGIRENPSGYCTYPGLVDRIVGEELAGVLAAGSADLLLRPAAGEGGMVGGLPAIALDPFSSSNWIRDPGAMLAEYGGGSLSSARF